MVELSRRGASRILDRWQPVSAGLGGLVALNVLVYLLLIRPTVQTSGDREAILDAARQRLATASAELDGIEKTSSKYACTVSDAAFVYDQVLSSKSARMTAVQREIRKLARDNRLDPDRLAYAGTPIGTSGLMQFSITFPLEGPFEMLRKFIAAVESSPNFLVVNDVSLTGDRAQAGSLKLQVTVSTYFVDADLARLEAAFPKMSRRRS